MKHALELMGEFVRSQDMRSISKNQLFYALELSVEIQSLKKIQLKIVSKIEHSGVPLKNYKIFLPECTDRDARHEGRPKQTDCCLFVWEIQSRQDMDSSSSYIFLVKTSKHGSIGINKLTESVYRNVKILT
jgi:hypothetical protein